MGRSFADAIESSERLGKVFDNVQLETDYAADSHIKMQLRQVARLIKAREVRNAERDFFFVQQRGYDTHNDLVVKLDELFLELDHALKGFVKELEAQKIFDSVVVVTASDFGRTLTFNGRGTDHGWGGNHFVLGGSIKGGKIFNKFLETYAEGSEYDAGRGRVLPQYPWENMLTPIAEWMGIERPSEIFENLHNFNDTLINSVRDLFNQ